MTIHKFNCPFCNKLLESEDGWEDEFEAMVKHRSFGGECETP